MDEALERQEALGIKEYDFGSTTWEWISDILSALGKYGHVSYDIYGHIKPPEEPPAISGPMHDSDVILHEEPRSSSRLTTYQYIPDSFEDKSLLIHTHGDDNTLFNILRLIGGLIGVSKLITTVPSRSSSGIETGSHMKRQLPSQWTYEEDTVE